MNNTKKILLCVLILPCFLMTSCEDTIDEGIIGKWEIIEKGYYDFNDSLIMETIPGEDRQGYIEFKSDNQYRYYSYINAYIERAEYKIKGDKLYVTYNKNKDNTFVDTYKLNENNNKLRLEYYSGVQLYNYPFYSIRVYKRIK